MGLAREGEAKERRRKLSAQNIKCKSFGRNETVERAILTHRERFDFKGGIIDGKNFLNKSSEVSCYQQIEGGNFYQ